MPLTRLVPGRAARLVRQDDRPRRGHRPPLLRDCHDDLVAEPLLLPVPSRTIVIQATELLMVN